MHQVPTFTYTSFFVAVSIYLYAINNFIMGLILIKMIINLDYNPPVSSIKSHVHLGLGLGGYQGGAYQQQGHQHRWLHCCGVKKISS